MTPADIENLARAARGNIQGSISITHNLTVGSPSPGDYIVLRMNAVLRAVVNSDFHPSSQQNVAALYAAIAEAQPSMIDNTHNLALVNMARSFAVVMEEAINHRARQHNNNNNNNNNQPAPSPFDNYIAPAVQEIRPTRLLGFGPPSTPRAQSSPAPAERRSRSVVAVPAKDAKHATTTTTKFNKASDIGFSTIPVTVDSKELVLIYDNLLCFTGVKGVLATRHEFPIAIDGNVYSSVDHYYQSEKCKKLVPGKVCTALQSSIKQEDEQYRQQVKDLEAAREKKKDGKTAEKAKWAPLNHSLAARAFLKENRVPPHTVETWRRTDGVVAVYRAIAAKAQQCSELRNYLHSVVDKIILHTYAGDAIFGCGADAAAVCKWAEERAEKRGRLQIPLAPLLNHKAIIMSPQIAQGRNLLGLIHMQLAEQIRMAGGGVPLPSGFSRIVPIPTPRISLVDNEKKEDEKAES